MAEETWGEYSKLVLKELERLNDNYDTLKESMDNRFNELNQKLTEFKNVEGKVDNHEKWIKDVMDVWSVPQMKEAKDEIYKQKNRWVAAIAILSFLQVVITIGISIWTKLK